MKMAMVNIDSMLPPGQIIQRLSGSLTDLLGHLYVSSACIWEFFPMPIKLFTLSKGSSACITFLFFLEIGFSSAIE